MLSCIIQNNTNNSHSNQSSSLRAKQNACFSLVDEIRNASSKLVLADDSCTRVSARNERDDLLPTRQGRSRNTFSGAVRRGGGERRKRAAVVFSRKVRASGKEDDQSWSQLSRRSATVIESTPSHAPPTPVFIHPTTDGRRTPSATAESRNKGGSRERESGNIYFLLVAHLLVLEGGGQWFINEWPPVKGYLSLALPIYDFVLVSFSISSLPEFLRNTCSPLYLSKFIERG